jgi:hypothetical protein
MRRSSTLLFVLCCAGMFVVAAPAKEIERVVVCGATDCRTIAGNSTQLEKIFAPTGAEVAARSGGTPFYTIDVYTGPHDPNHWQTLYMRDARLLRSVPQGPSDPVWWKLAPGTEGGLREAVAGLEPYGAAPGDSFPLTPVLAGVLGASSLIGALGFIRRRRD